MLIALVLIVASFLLYFDFIAPAYVTVQALKGKVASGQQSLDVESKVITQAQNLIAQYKNETQTQQLLDIALPTGPDVVGALAQIYGLATANSITVQSVGVSTPSAPKVSTKANASSTLVEPLGSLTLQFTGGGSYENFKTFLGQLETNLRIFDLQSLTISPNSSAVSAGAKAGTGANPDFFTYNVAVDTHYQAN